MMYSYSYKTQINQSIKELIKIINIYYNISDYTINWNKFTILPIHGDNSHVIPQIPNLPPTTGNIIYLGLQFSTKLSELFHLNFTPLLKQYRTT